MQPGTSHPFAAAEAGQDVPRQASFSGIVPGAGQGFPPPRPALATLHPATTSSSDQLVQDGHFSGVNLPALKPFSLNGMFFHVMLSYRVATEGLDGNGLVQNIYTKLHELSTQDHDLFLPLSAIGRWPHFSRKPQQIRAPQQVKCFWDNACLLDGQPWLEGFVMGLSHSIVIVLLVSCDAFNNGSIGGLLTLGEQDRVDNVLLEFILALALLQIEDSSVRALIPVMVGSLRLPEDNFSRFPFEVLSRLPDKPSLATNAKACFILRQLGAPAKVVEEVRELTVKGAVNWVLRHQGMDMSAHATRQVALDSCARRVLQVKPFAVCGH